MDFVNVFSGMTVENQDKPVKRDFNYFVEEKRSKKELLDYFKRIAKKFDVDPDDIKPNKDEEEEEEEDS
jgi:hypothetical protein